MWKKSNAKKNVEKQLSREDNYLEETNDVAYKRVENMEYKVNEKIGTVTL
jgi:hypothetical protein